MRKRILYITLARVTEAKVNAGGTLYYSLTRESEVLKAQAPYDKGGEVEHECVMGGIKSRCCGRGFKN